MQLCGVKTRIELRRNSSAFTNPGFQNPAISLLSDFGHVIVKSGVRVDAARERDEAAIKFRQPLLALRVHYLDVPIVLFVFGYRL